MHLPTHVLSGWVFANALPLTARERLFCMVSAAVADVDGLGFFFGEEAYWRFHHVVGHNVFFGLLMSLALAAASSRRILAFAAYFTCFHIHLLMDLYGSGVGWRIHYLWPIEPAGFKSDAAWPLMSWQNYLAFTTLALVTAIIAVKKRRSPLELLLPRLERRWFGPVDGG